MDEIFRQSVVLAALGYFWWRQVKRSRARRQLQLAAPDLDGDAQVAIHLARHVASSRGQRLGAVHLLYALVQDDTVATAIREAGGNPEAIERRLDEALDAGEPDTGDGEDVLARVAGKGCASIWTAVGVRAPIVAALTRAGGVAAVDVLFVLAHGTKEPPLALPPAGQVEIVFVNDDHSTMELVVELLRDVFGLDEERAGDEMLRVHHGGRAAVTTLPVEVARAKITEARDRARRRGFPLWILAQTGN